MRFTTIPKEINIFEIKNMQNSLSSSNYEKVNFRNSNCLSLRDLLDRELNSSDKGYEVGSNSYINNSSKFFIRTGCLKPESFILNFNKEDVVPILPSTFKDYKLSEGDILISKDSNIGVSVFLDRNLPDHTISGGLYKLPLSKFKLYIFGFLKSQYYSKQLDILSSKGVTIRHAKTLFLDCKIPFPNHSNQNEVISIIELFVDSIVKKEKEILRKCQLISKLINEEILNNQNSVSNEYLFPIIKEIRNSNRMDTGIFSKNFKRIDFLLRNYKNGMFFINPKYIHSGNTPTERIIKNNEYFPFQWLTPSNFTDFGTFDPCERIHCRSYNLPESALLLINRTSRGGKGEYVGRSIFYDFSIFGKGQHNQGIYRVEGYDDITLIFMACYLNTQLLREYCACLSVGSKMKEIKTQQFLSIPFPSFSESKKQEIALYYRSSIGENKFSYKNPEDFRNQDRQWLEKAGIMELDLEIKKLKKKIENLFESIILDNNIDLGRFL